MQPPTIVPPCNTCLQFEDFKTSPLAKRVYYSKAHNLTITCQDGSQTVVPVDAGIVTYVLTFSIGNPPYPNLVTFCSGGTVSIPVPDSTTQAQLDALIYGMLDQCLSQIAKSIGCPSGVFYNTETSISPCTGNLSANSYLHIVGAIPPGVLFLADQDPQPCVNLTMPAGIIQSTVSVADANAKAKVVLIEIFNTGNIVCVSSCGSI